MKTKIISDILQWLSCIFFPNRCIFCEKLMPPFDSVCDACDEELPWIKDEICVNCGAEVKNCECKKRHGNYYEAIAGVFYYKGNVKKALLRFKYNSDVNAGKTFAHLMAKTCNERFSDTKFDYVAYIPMDKKRERSREYNQSRLLARDVSKELGVPFGDNLLIKLFPTDIQHERSMLERKGNLLGAFDVNSDFDVAGKNVLLVDDIKTSGATLNECGKMLYLNGANYVFCLTAALVNDKI